MAHTRAVHRALQATDVRLMLWLSVHLATAKPVLAENVFRLHDAPLCGSALADTDTTLATCAWWALLTQTPR